VLSRTLTDLAKQRTEESLFPEELAQELEELFGNVARAIQSFAELITTQVAENAEEAEERLGRALGGALESRNLVAALLLAGVQEHPRQWQLHGALLAEVDRILDELAVDKRSQRLVEELDRQSQEMSERHPRLHMISRRLAGSRVYRRVSSPSRDAFK